MRYIAVPLLMLFLLVGQAWSQRHRQQQESGAAQQLAAPQQRGTEQAPLVIQLQQPTQTQAKSENNAGERPKEGGDSWFFGWTLSDKIAAIASCAAALQFIALVATIMVMVRNGRRQLRAYVFPEEIALVDGTMLNPPAQIHANEPGVVLSFRNSGQTPAYRVVTWAQIAVAEPKDENNLIVPPLQKNVFECWLGANGRMPKAIWFGRILLCC